MRAKTITPDTFEEFYESAPKEIKDYIDRCANTPQTLKWHPEGDVCRHTKIVFNRAKRTGDINMMLAAIFHDLGKADVTKKSDTISDKWSAHGHEKISAHLVEKYSNWIEEMGGVPEIVYYIVDQHMRIQQISKMRPAKQEKFRKDKYYKLVHQFSEFDDMITKDYKNDID